MMAIRSAIQYDPHIAGFGVEDSVTGARKTLQLDFIRDIFGQQMYKEHMEFVTSLNSAANWDKPTMILTMLINLFASDRPGLTNKQLVSDAEDHYTVLLKAYLRSKYPQFKADAMYPRLLMKLADVRNLGDTSKKTLNMLSVTKADDLAPLLKEVLTPDLGE